MTIHDDDLGGRLRLRNPADLPAAQKQIYDRLNTGMIQWGETPRPNVKRPSHTA